MTTPNAPTPGFPGVGTRLDQATAPKVRPVSVKAQTASSQLLTGVGKINNVTFAETTGSARALAYLHDGADANAPIVACVGGPSSSTGAIDFGAEGIGLDFGIYLEVVAGSITVTIGWMNYIDRLPG